MKETWNVHHEGLAYRLYVEEITKIPLLAVDEERELLRQVRNGDSVATQKLVEANLRFVIKIALKFKHFDVSLLDLINEGNIGLIEAARRFDINKNVRFLTYAVWWINQSIHHYLTHQGRMIPVGTKITSILSKLRKVSVKKDLDSEEISRESTARRMGITQKELDEALQFSRRIMSLQMPVTKEGEGSLSDNIPQNLFASAEQLIIAKQRRWYLKQLMSHLTQREASVLEMRFGIDGKERMTLQEIGNVFGLTRERIRQIESHSIDKLRSLVGSNTISKYA
ncbi:MAG TPA: RNA polymerase sigma factor RpoD/SigA [Acidobacteriota bacterium]|nr:RNA polymerase sigma factor RpoD/SigA [Acidobacteriota bacterium]